MMLDGKEKIMTIDSIKRYTVSGDIAYPIHEDPEGDYVTYEDHVAAIKADRKRRGEPVKLCDCERGHNGMGMAGRECDCPGNNPQPAENSVNLEVAIQAISALHSNDTDWDTSYWNQAVGRCVSELNKLRSQQPAEPVKVPSNAEMAAIWDEAHKPFGGAPFLMSHVEYSRALLARYGQPAEPVIRNSRNTADPVKALTKDEIRAILLKHGYTIKPGHDDLKPYVYAAALEMIALAQGREQ
ncbi:MAG: hypothetical protein WCZ87_02385 [Thiohalobacteraceae bacterium]